MFPVFPSAEALGYFRASLWDWNVRFSDLVRMS
jgi:hypothetical protein